MKEGQLDPLYKENLIEWIYDEKKVVTYHFLSVTLGVHVNLAKQMLYEFYNEEVLHNQSKRFKKGVLEVVYFISGTEESMSENTCNNVESKVKYVSTLCIEEKLADLKSKLSKIFSIHVYSIKLNESKETLEEAVKETLLLRNNEGKYGADFGPFILAEPQKVITTKAITNGGGDSYTVKQEKSDSLSEKSSTSSTDKVTTSTHTANKEPIVLVKKEKSKEQAGPGKSKIIGRQKTLDFTKGTIKEKSNEKLSSAKNVKEEKVEHSDEEVIPSKNNNKDPAPQKLLNGGGSSRKRPSQVEECSDEEVIPRRKKEKPARKKVPASKKKPERSSQPRRRIVVQSDSSDSDSERSKSESGSNSEEECDQEEVIPKSTKKGSSARATQKQKHVPLIVSDSDNEEDESSTSFVKREKSVEPVPSLPPCKPGRKRVTKTITKREVDEDGYTVIKKEQLIVTESDSEYSESEEKKKPSTSEKAKALSQKTEKVVKKPEVAASSNSNKKVKPSTSPPPTPKPTKKSNASKQQGGAGKSKQPSILSFFQKK